MEGEVKAYMEWVEREDQGAMVKAKETLDLTNSLMLMLRLSPVCIVINKKHCNTCLDT